jgi:hypothetical protein
MHRIAYSALGLVIEEIQCLTLMGGWDHIYENSILDENISTHYVDLANY